MVAGYGGYNVEVECVDLDTGTSLGAKTLYCGRGMVSLQRLFIRKSGRYEVRLYLGNTLQDTFHFTVVCPARGPPAPRSLCISYQTGSNADNVLFGPTTLAFDDYKGTYDWAIERRAQTFVDEPVSPDFEGKGTSRPNPHPDITIDETPEAPAFVEYNTALGWAIHRKWQALMKMDRGHPAKGRVVVWFQLHSDGAVSDPRVGSRTPSAKLTATFVEQAVTDPAPYARWPGPDRAKRSVATVASSRSLSTTSKGGRATPGVPKERGFSACKPLRPNGLQDLLTFESPNPERDGRGNGLTGGRSCRYSPNDSEYSTSSSGLVVVVSRRRRRRLSKVS